MPNFERYVGDILVDSPRVRTLMLNGHREKIDDEGARRLADALLANSRMNRIFLGRNNITSAGASDLADALLRTSAPVAHFTSIVNSVEDGGALSFAKTLRTNTRLVSLRLEGAGIRTEGAVALAEALRYNSTLQDLNLCANFIGVEAAVAFLRGMRRTDGDEKYDLNAVLGGNHNLHTLKVDWYVRPNNSGDHVGNPPQEAINALAELKALLAMNKHGPKKARQMKIGRFIDSDPLSVVRHNEQQLQLETADAKLVPEVLAAVGRSASLGSMHAIIKQMPSLFDDKPPLGERKLVRPLLRPLEQVTRKDAVVLKRKRPQLHRVKHHSRPSSPPRQAGRTNAKPIEYERIEYDGARNTKTGFRRLLCESMEESIIDRRAIQNYARDHSEIVESKSPLIPSWFCVRN